MELELSSSVERALMATSSLSSPEEKERRSEWERRRRDGKGEHRGERECERERERVGRHTDNVNISVFDALLSKELLEAKDTKYRLGVVKVSVLLQEERSGERHRRERGSERKRERREREREGQSERERDTKKHTAELRALSATVRTTIFSA